jgi:hypothetical protein
MHKNAMQAQICGSFSGMARALRHFFKNRAPRTLSELPCHRKTAQRHPLATKLVSKITWIPHLKLFFTKK